MRHPTPLNGLLGALLAVIFAVQLPAAEPAAPASLVVFLVRHAEKVDASRDPELSAEGTKRAHQLASVLRDAGLTRIHSSDYIRTRNTAAPIADQLKLKVKLYDPKNLPALIEQMRKTGGRHLVVGHSTTTPAAVKLLGGKPGPMINEKGEFDRLYVIHVGRDGQVETILMRYGKPFSPPN